MWIQIEGIKPEVEKIPKIEQRLSIVEKWEGRYVENSKIEILSKQLTDLRWEYENWVKDYRLQIKDEIKI